MNYVILRDDDTCALTPVSCLDRLYRPFLERGLTVHLATIPNVNTRATWKDGSEEGFLFAKQGQEPSHLPLGSNTKLLQYLHSNPCYKLLHHGYEHTYLEFAATSRRELGARLDAGKRCFEEAGIEPPDTFVAPYDQLSTAAFREIAKRFNVLSTGWFELRKLPLSWWPRFIVKKLKKQPHWQCGNLRLMSHPGCLLSHKRPLETMLGNIKRHVLANDCTVLVTHWWEYFHQGRTNEAFITVLHELAEWLASERQVQVIGFDQFSQLKSNLSSKRQPNTPQPHLTEVHS